eukprot:1138767-Pelagomonas_calceolata.AAC.1
MAASSALFIVGWPMPFGVMTLPSVYATSRFKLIDSLLNAYTFFGPSHLTEEEKESCSRDGSHGDLLALFDQIKVEDRACKTRLNHHHGQDEKPVDSDPNTSLKQVVGSKNFFSRMRAPEGLKVGVIVEASYPSVTIA